MQLEIACALIVGSFVLGLIVGLGMSAYMARRRRKRRRRFDLLLPEHEAPFLVPPIKIIRSAGHQPEKSLLQP